MLAHENSDEIQKKKLKSLIFMAWWRGVLIRLSQDYRWAKFRLLSEIFNFWSKLLNFNGVSPWKEWRNPKKIEIFNFQGTTKGGINLTFLGWSMCEILSVVGNFQFSVQNWILKVLAHEKSDEIQFFLKNI